MVLVFKMNLKVVLCIILVVFKVALDISRTVFLGNNKMFLLCKSDFASLFHWTCFYTHKINSWLSLHPPDNVEYVVRVSCTWWLLVAYRTPTCNPLPKFSINIPFSHPFKKRKKWRDIETTSFSFNQPLGLVHRWKQDTHSGLQERVRYVRG